MNRRAFLGWIGRAAGVAAVSAAVPSAVLEVAGLVEDPEKLLWIPGQKSIIDLGAGARPDIIGIDWASSLDDAVEAAVFGKRGGGNTLLTISAITHEALKILEKNLAFTSRVNRMYDEKFDPKGVSIEFRKPRRYQAMTRNAVIDQMLEQDRAFYTGDQWDRKIVAERIGAHKLIIDPNL